MAEALTLENHLKCETDIYRLSGLPDESIERRNVCIGQHDGEDIFIRTIIVKNEMGQSPKPDLL